MISCGELDSHGHWPVCLRRGEDEHPIVFYVCAATLGLAGRYAQAVRQMRTQPDSDKAMAGEVVAHGAAVM